MISALPGMTAVTVPLLSTVAISVSELSQIISGYNASAGVTDTVSVAVSPILRFIAFGVTLTDSTSIGVLPLSLEQDVAPVKRLNTAVMAINDFSRIMLWF